jgi:glutamate--cysteine ligase
MNIVWDTLLKGKEERIADWFEAKYRDLFLPIYNSFDIRVSNNKICPVDANFFPAAFNRLSEESILKMPRYLEDYLNSLDLKTEKILLVPEKSISNNYYLANLLCLKKCLEKANREVIIGTIKQPLAGKIEVSDYQGNKFEVYSLRIRDNIIKTSNGFRPDVIVMNNDMRKVPVLIEKARQKILPDIKIGWWKREKIDFFLLYNNVVNEFCQEFELSKDLFSIETETYDLNNEFVFKLENFYQRLKDQYQRLNIEEEPYIIIKPFKGTYGQSVVKVSSKDDIEKAINYYHNTISSNKAMSLKLIVQEGIRTRLRINQYPAEPVIYTVGRRIVGGFYRFNPHSSEMENLNCRGAKFDELTIGKEVELVAQLANLATSIEINRS